MLTVRVRWTLLLVIAFLGLAPSQQAEGGEFLKRLFGRCGKRQVAAQDCQQSRPKTSFSTKQVVADICPKTLQLTVYVNKNCAFKVYLANKCRTQYWFAINVPCDFVPCSCNGQFCFANNLEPYAVEFTGRKIPIDLKLKDMGVGIANTPQDLSFQINDQGVRFLEEKVEALKINYQKLGQPVSVTKYFKTFSFKLANDTLYEFSVELKPQFGIAIQEVTLTDNFNKSIIVNAGTAQIPVFRPMILNSALP